MMDFMREEMDVLKQRLHIKQSYTAIFEQPHGKLVLNDIIRRGGLYSVSVPKDANPERTAFNEGKRALVLEILSMLRMDNEVAMLKNLQERDTGERQ